MRNIINYAAIILLLFSNIFFYVKWKSCPTMLHETVKLDSTVSIPTVRYTASDSTEHIIIDNKINQIVASEVSETASKIEPIIKELAENLSVKSKQIENSTTISTTTNIKETELQKRIDSLEKLTFFYKDKYLDIAFTPNEDKNPTFNFSYNADLNITQYWKKKWFLGAKESYTDISSNDPRTTIRGVRKFTVVQKQPTLGLRLQGVGGYSINSKAFFAGPSIRFDIKDLSIRGSYFYNTTTKQWSPNIATEYNIIKF